MELHLWRPQKKTIDVGKSFEAGMSEVRRSPEHLEKTWKSYLQKAKQMGATTKFSATESATALKYMAMAGWKNKSDGFWIVRCHELSCSIWRRPWNSIRHCNGLNDRFRIESKGFWTFADVLAKASSSSNTNVAMMGETFKYVALW